MTHPNPTDPTDAAQLERELAPHVLDAICNDDAIEAGIGQGDYPTGLTRVVVNAVLGSSWFAELVAVRAERDEAREQLEAARVRMGERATKAADEIRRRALAEAELAAAQQRIEVAVPNQVCGATEGSAVCNKPPHSVELLPEGDPNHSRWHQDRRRDGSLWAEWSSVTDREEGRLWPDGHIGPRVTAALGASLAAGHHTRTDAEIKAAALVHAANVMMMLDVLGPGIVPHLMDSDDNEGQRLRESLDALGIEASAEERGYAVRARALSVTPETEPMWLHDDGSLCNETLPIGQKFAHGPLTPKGRQWWCTTHQSYLRWSGVTPETEKAGTDEFTCPRCHLLTDSPGHHFGCTLGDGWPGTTEPKAKDAQ